MEVACLRTLHEFIIFNSRDHKEGNRVVSSFDQDPHGDPFNLEVVTSSVIIDFTTYCSLHQTHCFSQEKESCIDYVDDDDLICLN